MLIILQVIRLKKVYAPTHDILIITYAHKNFKCHADIPRGASGGDIGLSIHLHPYFAYVSSEGSGVSALLSLCCWTMRQAQKYHAPIHFLSEML